MDKILLDLDTVEPTLAGPKRPQDKILLKEVPNEFSKIDKNQSINNKLNTGDIVIAAITSCTNTSNPNVMIAAGLIAKNQTTLNRVYHLDRGYENLEKKLRNCGAKITRVNN